MIGPDRPEASPPHAAVTRRLLLCTGLTGLTALLPGCAVLGNEMPLRVNLVGIDPLPGEGLEWRFMARLRLQNPSEQSFDFDGLSLDIELRRLPFASGVSSQRGSLPRFGELVLGVPVTVPAGALVRQGLSLLRRGGEVGRIAYAVRGRLGGNFIGGMTGATRFEAQGEIDWPPGPPASGTPGTPGTPRTLSPAIPPAASSNRS